MKRVYLGGTCNGSEWRSRLIPLLDGIGYFDPVVDDWNDAAAATELFERQNDDWLLYVFTPCSDNVFGVAEAVDDSNKHPEKTLLCVLEYDGGKLMGTHQMKSFSRVCEMAERNGARVFASLEEVAHFLNKASR